MQSIQDPKTFFSEASGKKYRINFTPEASKILVAQAIHYVAAPSQNPFTSDKIARLLALHTFEARVPIQNAPHAMIYGCRSNGKVYQIVASLLPDSGSGLPICEVHHFQESTDLAFNKLIN